MGVLSFKNSYIGANKGKTMYKDKFVFRTYKKGAGPEEVAQIKTLSLKTRKAFPTAFGYGRIATGGRGGQLIEVTNTNDSGPGSLREALLTTGAREIVIKTSGIIDLVTDIVVTDTYNNFTIIGQTAPGEGITITGETIRIDCANWIIRHISARLRTGSVSNDDTMTTVDSPSNSTVYLDHCSIGYGLDEAFTFNEDGTGTDTRVTVANCLFAESHPDHNTGSIMGSSTYEQSTETAGKYTYARNMTYNISHRFPNFTGNQGILENYNNLIVNWRSHIVRTNNDCSVDFYNNYAYAGNAPKYNNGTLRHGYWHNHTTVREMWHVKGNIIEGRNEDPNSNQEDLCTFFYTQGPYTVGSQMGPEWHSDTKIGEGFYPADGLWTATEVLEKLPDVVGHNVGTNNLGEPVNGRDDLDDSYINKLKTNTTESTYRAANTWNLPTITGGSPFADSNNSGISDSFRSKHNLSGDGSAVTLNWDFPGYKLINDAGYSDREIYWAYLAGDLDALVEAGNSITDTSYEILEGNANEVLTLNTMKAFPTAKGKGRNTSGGRGGTVIKVTNLNTSGAGSLKAALDTTGPRTIVFDVSGVIKGAGDGVTWYPKGQVTIDGSTAPGEGIEIQNITFDLSESEVIFRNLRFRGGFNGTAGKDCIRIKLFTANGDVDFRNAIFDRCSLYYATDEAFSTNAVNTTTGPNNTNPQYDIQDVSVQRCIFGHNWYAMLISYYTRGISLVENFSGLNVGREMGYSSDGTCELEMVNCLTYDAQWNHWPGVYGVQADVIGNYLRMPTTDGTPNNTSTQMDLSSTTNEPVKAVGDSNVYILDNTSEFNFAAQYDTDIQNRMSNNRVLSGNITIPYSSADVPTKVLDSRGAGYKPWDRDSIDQALIDDFNNRTGQRKSSVSFANNNDFANPIFSSVDTGATGIPQSFRDLHNISDPNAVKVNWTFNGKSVINNAGYTNIEMYMFSINRDFDELFAAGNNPNDTSYNISTGSEQSAIELTSIKSFPTAQGFGRNATGGRGGTVYKVTNLNNSGTGSLRAALEASGKRIVVFEVGGIITLTSQIVINNGDLTIAGETAPGDGILITQNGQMNNGLIAINAPNVIMRGLALRPVEYTGSDPDPCCQDSFNIWKTGNVIVDHCSFSWGSDETLSIANLANGGVIQDVTVQNCSISEAQNKYNHAYGSLISGGATRISIYRNLFAHNSQRNPLVGGGSPDPPGRDHETVENVVYNWISSGMVYSNSNNATMNVNIINNVVIDGPSNNSSRYGICINDEVLAYARGNFADRFRTSAAQPEWDAIGCEKCYSPGSYMTNPADPSWQTNTPFNFPLKDVPTKTRQEVIDTVLDNFGKFKRDAVDNRHADDVRNGTGAIINVPSDVGGLPTINGGTAPTDTNGNGMPDSFEQEHGVTDANSIKYIWNIDNRIIINKAGYTNIEMYLFWKAGDFDKLASDGNLQFDNSYNVGDTNLVAPEISANKAKYDTAWASEKDSRHIPIANSTDEGDKYYAFSGFDGAIAMFRALGDTTYLEQAVDIILKHINSANTTYNSGQHEGWVDGAGGLTNGVGANDGGSHSLSIGHGFRQVPHLLWVIAKNPIIKTWSNKRGTTYGDDYNTIKNWFVQNVYDRYYFEQGNTEYGGIFGRSRTWIASHWANFCMYLHQIYDLTGENNTKKQQFYNVMDAFVNDMSLLTQTSSMKGQLYAHPTLTDAYQWSGRWGETNTNIADVSHSNAEVNAMVNMHEQGLYFTDEDMRKLKNTLIGILEASPDPDYDNIPELIDAVYNSADDNRDLIHQGWANLGRYDSTLQGMLENLNEGQMNSSDYASVYWGHMTFNRAYLNNKIIF